MDKANKVPGADGVFKTVAGAVGRLAVSMLTDRLNQTTKRLTEYAAKGGGPGLLSAVTGNGVVGTVLSKGVDKAKQALGGGAQDGQTKGQQLKVTNIVEQLDIGAPVRVCYDQWTRFTDFPTFMKKVETVEQESDEKLTWRAQIFLSHRMWQSTIIEQVPDRRIIWRSTADKGHVDGAVTFHELAPELTRMVVVLEYHPKGFFEKTGNLWRAQGRRVRLELKHFARHVMTQTVLHPEETKGWRGEIHDGEVVESAEDQDRDEDTEQDTEQDTDQDTEQDTDEDTEQDTDQESEENRESGQKREPAKKRQPSKK